MGTHGASVRARALPPARRAAKSTNGDVNQRRQLNLTLTDWPVARRLFAVIVAALLMGLVFGALRVADAENSASQFSRTQQLANLGAQLVTVVNDLQNERDATLVALITGSNTGLPQLQAKTNSDLGPVRSRLQQIVNGGFPATITADAGAVNNALSASNIGPVGNTGQGLHQLFYTALPDGDVVSPDYEAVITDIITLQDQVSLGNTDQSLTSDVQALNAFSEARDLTSQQLALLDQSMANPLGQKFPVGDPGFLDFTTETSLQVDYVEEFNDEAAFQSSASQAENAMYDDLLGPQAAKLDGETQSDNIEQALFTVATGQTDEAQTTPVPIIATTSGGTSAISFPKLIANEQLDPLANNPTTAKQDGITTIPQLKAAWDKGIGAKLAAMQDTEQFVANNIVNRATQLQQSASQTALTYIVITVVVLLIVLLAALLVARSLVLPLRRLRAGALDVASVQLPERVRLLSDDPESAATMQVAPINVTSQDEIGQVARAFDQVHSEAVRLAGEQALLRSSFNAMFVNLSRRSQTLIERLARMIDTLEQNEDDPDRLGSLFSMDHLVTRMRRNSENLLLLAGHENPRKRSESVPIADIARAATSEIEQYNRVTLNIPPGISVVGQAVSDVVHLIAELIENATIFSPKDTQVQVSMQELSSGGVLIEVVDKGIGVSEARLTEMNFRLDNPPTIDVSVSRHMGLFAVARLAERHRVRVRLRPALPQGLSALVWLPDSAIERSGGFGGGTSNWSAQPVGARTRAMASAAETAALTSGGGGSVGLASDYGTGTSDYGNGNGHGTAEGRTALGWFRGDEDGASRPRTAGALGGQDGGFSFGEPSVSDQTVGGLPVRVPRANMPPGAGPGVPDEPASGAPGGLTPGAQGGLPTRTPGAGRPAGTGHGPANGGNASPQRSPEQVRSRLAGFQRGTRRAEGQGGSGGQAPRPGEGTER
jgi:signal transduction histidine kinase